MSESLQSNSYDFSSDAPATPTEKRRSRYDAFNSPLQSPMIKISEEEGVYDNSRTLADLQPPPNSKRFSGHFSGSPKLPTGTLYSLDSGSNSSIHLPGGNIPGNRSSLSSLKYVPPPSIPSSRARSPSRNRSPIRVSSPVRNRSQSPKKFQPFNFKSTNFNATPVLSSSKPSHRKGHRYKHSSVSMNFFQEPKQRAPLKVQASYPVPNHKEILSSCTFDQKVKLSWSLFHLGFALITFLIGFKYSLHSFSTLSHLIFYDALACLTVVFVNIMGNFDVWSKSSIKFPFGLGRIEVLFGFALSVSLIFVGCDLISHFVEEFMISFFDGASEGHAHSGGHNHHEHDEQSPVIGDILYEIIIFITLLITFISSRITSSDKFRASLIPSLSSLKESIITNPTHIITLIFASYLALNPLLLSLKSDIEINKIATLVISVLICYMGWKVVKHLGYIVLLSFPGTDSKNVISSKIQTSIESSDYFKSSYRISNLIVSQVHLNLIIVLINIKMGGGSDDEETNLRYQVNDLLKRTFQKEKVETIVETTVDIDRL